ncbi:Zinc finger, C2H2-like [Penicillium camemberti]|uniref:Zinc finger, C2H2-like n=1 Tax=Penicillium camemberti (strain FM 013) TaxID=1429867 RepID=A0A0G4PWB9_PENC3|nr:Zinc finger, C2H2-like [Penicillium camemberti]
MASTEDSSQGRALEESVSEPLASAPRNVVKFEEAEMPSLGHITMFSDGVYRCRYLNCEWKTGEDKKYLTRKHARIHVKPVKCPQAFCDYRTAEQTDMRRHVVTHHKPWAREHLEIIEKFTCDKCGSSCTRNDNLRRHRKRTCKG